MLDDVYALTSGVEYVTVDFVNIGGCFQWDDLRVREVNIVSVSMVKREDMKVFRQIK